MSVDSSLYSLHVFGWIYALAVIANGLISLLSFALVNETWDITCSATDSVTIYRYAVGVVFQLYVMAFYFIKCWQGSKGHKWDHNLQRSELFRNFGIVVFGVGRVMSVMMLRDPEGLSEVCKYLDHTTLILGILYVVTHILFILMFKTARPGIKDWLFRLGLLHLVAVDVCDWFSFVIEGVAVHLWPAPCPVNDTDVAELAMAKDSPEAYCFEEVSDSLSLLHPVGPFIACFSLLAGGATFRMYVDVGTTTVAMETSTDLTENLENSTAEKRGDDSDCHLAKLPWGRILGGLLFTAVLTFNIVLTVGRYSHDRDTVFSLPIQTVGVIQISILSSLIILTVIPGFYYNFKSPMIPPRYVHGEGSLAVSLLGVLVLSVMLINSCLMAKNYPENTETNETLSHLFTLMITLSFLVLTEVSLQYIFILDLLRREPYPRQSKGNDVLIFMVCVNLSLWITQTLQTEDIAYLLLLTGEYNRLQALLIVYIINPFTTYFRFRSSIRMMDVYGHTISPAWKKLRKKWRKFKHRPTNKD